MISAIYERKNSSLIEFQGKWRICHMTRKYRDSAMTKTIIKHYDNKTDIPECTKLPHAK